jgi:trans-aconitate 2-methyltransferase
MADWDAASYHRLSNPQVGWGRRVLERLAPRPGERILDLGCGTGRLTAELVTALGHGTIVAVDRSETMLREATSQALPGPHRVGDETLASGHRHVHFVRADGACLPFVDTFDAVLSTATFHWIHDHPALFASIYRALAPGGRLVAQCGGGPNVQRLYDRAAGLMRLPRFARYFDDWRDPWLFADVPSTIHRLREAAFTAIDVYLEEAPTTMPDRQTFRDFLATVCAHKHIARLPEVERGAFLDMLADEAAADEPPYTLDYWRLNILAQKPAGIEQAA